MRRRKGGKARNKKGFGGDKGTRIRGKRWRDVRERRGRGGESGRMKAEEEENGEKRESECERKCEGGTG